MNFNLKLRQMMKYRVNINTSWDTMLKIFKYEKSWENICKLSGNTWNITDEIVQIYSMPNIAIPVGKLLLAKINNNLINITTVSDPKYEINISCKQNSIHNVIIDKFVIANTKTREYTHFDVDEFTKMKMNVGDVDWDNNVYEKSVLYNNPKYNSNFDDSIFDNPFTKSEASKVPFPTQQIDLPPCLSFLAPQKNTPHVNSPNAQNNNIEIDIDTNMGIPNLKSLINQTLSEPTPNITNTTSYNDDIMT